MNADVTYWGSKTRITEVDTKPEGAESIIFKDSPADSVSALRIFMTLDQLRSLRDQIDAALPRTVPEPEAEIATSETV